MTDKERLERIIQMQYDGYTIWDMGENDLVWLIEQAERVQELEEDLLELVKQNKELRKSIEFYSSESYNAHLERLLDRSEKQIKRYREALEFYAEGKHVAYKLDETDDDLVVDYGEKARQALGGVKNNEVY